MNYFSAKKVILPVEEALNAVQRLLSEKEARNNLRLVRQMARIRVRMAELMTILQRLKRAEDAGKNS